MTDLGHDIIWTPPYTPETQPIETFWGEGNGYARRNYRAGQTMRETVNHIRDWWYRNEFLSTDGHDGLTYRRGNFGMLKKAADCAKHIEHSIMECDKRVVWCGGITGTMRGGVTILPGYSADTAVPIDAIIDLTRADENNPNESDNGVSDLVANGEEAGEDHAVTELLDAPSGTVSL